MFFLHLVSKWLNGFAFGILYLISVSSLHAGNIHHGTLESFWRYSAALGGYPDFHVKGQALIQVPDYLCSGNDFAYQKRPFDKEVMFADHLSMVRFLGGFAKRLGASVEVRAEQDLAYRNPSPEGINPVIYRMQLVEKRMRPYLDAGYTDFTMVLDNIPWGLARNPTEGNIGQSGVPDDFDDWADFIEKVCLELETVCGSSVASKMRFRTGTEFQGTKRFNGNGDEDFMNYYNACWEGVSRVFPEALFGPCNLAGVRVDGLKGHHNMNAFNIPALKEKDAPFDWVSYSHYFLPREGSDRLIKPFVEVWEEFERLYPGIVFSKEIHEFGMQPWKDDNTGHVHREPGSSGIVTTLHTLLGLWNNGLERCWHWSVLDRCFDSDRKAVYLPQGNAWIYSVLDKMAGGDSWYLEADNQSSSDTYCTGLYSLNESDAYILLNAYSTDLKKQGSEIAHFRIPRDSNCELDVHRVTAAVANRNTIVHDLIYDDLKSAGLLVPFFRDNPEYRGTVDEMAYESNPAARSREGMHHVAGLKERYIQAWHDSLTLKPVSGREFSISDEGTHYLVSIEMAAPEAIVMRIPWNSHN